MKLSIIWWAGRVWSTLAFNILFRLPQITELVLYDINESVVWEKMDLDHVSQLRDYQCSIVWTTTIADCADSDYIVIVAGFSLSSLWSLDRYDLLIKNAAIVRSIVDDVSKTSPTARYVVVTNPVDVMTNVVYRMIQDPQRVVWLSTLTDTIRLKTVDDTSLLLGEHSGSMVNPTWNLDGSIATDLWSEVVKHKKWTWFLTSNLISFVLKNRIEWSSSPLPLCVFADNAYELGNLCVSLPCSINAEGIISIEKMSLSNEEQKILLKARDNIREHVAGCS